MARAVQLRVRHNCAPVRFARPLCRAGPIYPGTWFFASKNRTFDVANVRASPRVPLLVKLGNLKS